ncbi:sulfate permease [Caldanaerobius fijiensis DSM 17918]|uniref:Sulfate permease n=1 Tax=Caldanaerobius fijiensis DSM 17918 TaxID=1121256 RepID=A0A1M5C687_9THEO|nr:inorganic phosphate transporter [Caldanaerobius fijiensis]SHF50278.1 sulfate permease [Caldanaerobius fijiensis DSM 17918]
MLLAIALLISLFFAINIGASGTAASMGAAYGGGAIKTKWIALVLVGLSIILGAFTGGEEVVKTIGEGIIPSNLFDIKITIIILASACITLFIANILGIPLSTSEVTVGSVIGVGVAYQSLYIQKILFIMSIWLILPFAAFGIAYALGKMIPFLESKLYSFQKQNIVQKALALLLIVAGCYEAFSAGMNNVANAVGPLVATGLINTNKAIILGGIFVASGAVALGGKVLETNSKKITRLSLLQGCVVSFTSGTLVIIASIFGLPVPLTQATTMAIFGIGTSDRGINLWKSDIVKRILIIWIVSPVSSMVISFTLVNTMIEDNIYIVIIIIASFITSLGYIGLKNNYERYRQFSNF